MRKRRFWQTREFKTLEAEWYERLKQADFKDAEGSRHLKQNASNSYRQAAFEQRENKYRYFQLLGIYVHKEKEFKDDIERLVLEKRSGGAKIKEISLILKTMNARFSCRWQIWRVISKYEKKWGIKKR